MDISQKILSDIVIHMKYAKYLPEKQRRETWQEIVERNIDMHVKRFPELSEEIRRIYNEFVLPKKVLPSMRSMQFAGRPIELMPSRLFNCSYLPIDDWRAFAETMFLLLGGSGVGYSVQYSHIDKLPEINKPRSDRSRRWLIADSIEGWADAIKMLMKNYFFGGPKIAFDYGDIRPKGARLITSGGKAPGPQPLRECIVKIEGILESKQNGEKLTSLEAHDIVCHIADAVLSAGSRRSATIALFNADDDEMISCKSGNWWELNPQRGRANNSAVLVRHKITEKFFFDLWDRLKNSGSGEPGFFFTNNQDYGANPCNEVSLRPFQFCNLCEVNVSDVVDQQDLNDRVRAAAFIGTLQASYTDFHYLRPIWRRVTEKEALLGVSMTGIASGKVNNLNLIEAAEVVKEENRKIAKAIGINSAARLTCVKPAGSTSLVLGCSSGIHAWHNDYYIRRVRVGKNEAIYTYLMINHPELIEDEYFRPHDTAVISVPQRAPEGSILRTETEIELLERIKLFHQTWIKTGHVSGDNTNNVSATVSVKDENWDEVGRWVWENRDSFAGLSFLPYSNHTYKQAPFEDISKDEFDRLFSVLHDVDVSRIIELDDDTQLTNELACAGGQCEIQ